MIYSEEDIAVRGDLWEDEAGTIPVSFNDKELIVFLIKSNTDEIVITVNNNEIEKIENSFAFILDGKVTKTLNGNYRMQFNLIENGSIIKSIISGLYIKKSKDVVKG